MFRSRRVSDRLRVLQLVWRALGFLFSVPMSVAVAAGLAVGLILLSDEAAYELAMLVNTGLVFIWLLLPASYNSQLVERFEMSRLFVHPIRFRSIVVGSTLMSALTMTGIWSALLLVGEIVGLTWHRPLALPLILLGAAPVFVLLALTGRIMDDFFDLVARDRRLRALALGLLSLPFMLCWIGQYVFQYVTNRADELSDLARGPLLQGLERLSQASGPGEFLEILRPSRVLRWLPSGWATAGMGYTVGAGSTAGAWASQIGFLVLAWVFVALLLWVHAWITRKLMEGVALSVGSERVRTRKRQVTLPGPPALWALFDKDWAYLRRSPLPRRLVFSALMAMAGMALPILTGPDRRVHEYAPLLIGGVAVTMTSMVVNLGLTSNYFGAVDRDGFATLAFSALDRRLILISANLAASTFAVALYAVWLLLTALAFRSWTILPLGLYLGICIQLGGMPAYNLAAIIGPYRTQLKFSRSRQRGNLWAILAWVMAAAPILGLIVLPYIYWRPGLFLTLPLGAAYSLGLYMGTLKPLARLLQRREHEILMAVAVED